MVDFGVVDTHVHLWDPERIRYPWLEGNDLLNKPYLLEEYRTHCKDVDVEQMVFLQCECDPGQFRDEVALITELAGIDSRLKGIVAFAPLENGENVRGDLEFLAENSLVKGVRRLIQSEEDLEFCIQPGFVRGVQMLEEFDLSFDICIYHPQLANTIRMVQECPNVRFILDHIGKPDIKNGLMDPWKQEIETLASLPNVLCKVSGLVTEADHANWTPGDLRPYIDHVISSFGFDRVVFGSDWPVAFQACEYPVWVETLAEAVSSYTSDEVRNLFRNNAIAFYRL